MDFDLSEEQELLKRTAREFLEKECPKSVVLELENSELGYPPELWQKMAELGWLALPFPEKYEGIGGSLLDLTILLDEMGRVCCPGPYVSTVVHCGLAIADYGSEEQKQDLLPKIGSGNAILSLALTEPSATYEPEGVKTTAVVDGNDLVIDGAKLFVKNANVADYFLVVARTDEKAAPADGASIIIVPAKTTGISIEILKTINFEKQGEVVFKDVRVPKSALLGELNKGWPIVERIKELGALAECSQMMGGAQMVLETSIQYAKDRVQFGRPIGSFQAIQHKCANMVIDVDGMRYITYQAAWMLNEGLPASKEVAMAKAWCSDAYRRTVREAHQIHGGIGFTWEYGLHAYYRQAKAGEVMFGDADEQRELVAQAMGL